MGRTRITRILEDRFIRNAIQRMQTTYRGITLMSTTYKLYTEVIRRKVEKEVDEKNILPEGQSGFRKTRCTLDNILYVLNYAVPRMDVKGKLILHNFNRFEGYI